MSLTSYLTLEVVIVHYKSQKENTSWPSKHNLDSPGANSSCVILIKPLPSLGLSFL